MIYNSASSFVHTSSKINRKHLLWNNGLTQPSLLSQSEMPSHIQKNWEKPGIEETKSSLLSNCNNDRDRARLLASRAVHSGEWLNALPISSCGLRMGNDVIRAAVAFRIGNRLCEPHPLPLWFVGGRFRDAWTLVQQKRCSRSSAPSPPTE